MRITKILALLVLTTTLIFSAEVKNYEWEWTKKEIKKIEKIEKKVKEKDGFFVYENKENVVKSQISKRFTAELALYLDIFYDEWAEAFPSKPKGNVMVKLTTTIYDNKQSYVSSSRGIPRWSGGVFWPDWSKVGWPVWNLKSYPWTEKGKDFKFFHRPVLQHEGTHAIFQKYAGRDQLPVFFSEGAATYFEWWNLRQNSKTNRKERRTRTYRWKNLRRAFDEDPDFAPSLERKLTMTHSDWDPDGGGPELRLNYALAESFFDYMLDSSKGRKAFRKMVDEMYSGHALMKKKEYRKHEKKWHKHIKEVLLPLTAKSVSMKSEQGKLSFGLGYRLGNFMMHMAKQEKLEKSVIISGVMDALFEDKLKHEITVLKSDKKLLGYLYGVRVGLFLKDKKYDLDAEVFERGISDGFEGRTTAVKSQADLNAVCKLGIEKATEAFRIHKQPCKLEKDAE